MQYTPIRTKGFTIVELAISLVIIGLIIGGITEGASLIQQARLKSIITEYRNYYNAINAFKLQYSAMPGDMRNATQFWYNATTCPGTTGTAGGCNGDGNGIIAYTGATAGNGDEASRAWQHLSKAQLINGTYTGVYTVDNQADPDVNAPSSKFDGGMWNFEANGANYIGLGNATSIVFGGFTAGNTNITGALSPLNTQLIDEKIDDGLPNTGFMRPATATQGATGCSSSSANSYNVTAVLTNACYFMIALYPD